LAEDVIASAGVLHHCQSIELYSNYGTI
jgi:hypothetical protein